MFQDGPCVAARGAAASGHSPTVHSATTPHPHTLPRWQFHALLTLFPKSFSSFPHGTCMLSVSGLYLALDGMYHPFGLHSQAVRLALRASAPSRAPTGLSPSAAPRSRGLGTRPRTRTPTTTRFPDSNVGLLPLHSPLLRESLLVSPPPLTDMLKFSGSPCPSEAPATTGPVLPGFPPPTRVKRALSDGHARGRLAFKD